MHIGCGEFDCKYGERFFDPITKTCSCQCKRYFFGTNCAMLDIAFPKDLNDPIDCKTQECNKLGYSNCPAKCLCKIIRKKVYTFYD